MHGDMIAYWAKQRPHAVAVIADVDITYQTFDQAINKVAARLSAANLPPNGVVAIDMTGLKGLYLIERALARMGLATVVLPHMTPPGETLDLLQADALLTISEEHAGAHANSLVLSDAWFAEALKGPPDAPPAYQRRPDDLVRLVLSSGTTGRPKIIPLTWDSVERRAEATILISDLGHSSRLMNTMGPQTIAGFSAPFAIWMVGGAVVICGPQSIYLEIKQARANHLWITPGQLEALLEEIPQDAALIDGLRVLAMGSQVSKTLADRTKLRLTDDIRILYGSTEIGSVTSGDASVLDRHPRAVGYRWPKVEIEVVDADDAPLAAGRMGVLRMRATGVFSGYRDQEEETSSSPWRGGWFYPGDLGALTEDGLLVVEGRAAEVMNLGGVKIDPGAIDEVAKSCPGVADAAAFALPDEAGVDWPWITVVRGEGYDGAQLISTLQARWPALRTLQVAMIDAIPRNGMAKVERQTLKAMVRDAQKASQDPSRTQPTS